MTVDANDLTPEKLAEYQKAQGAVTSALGKLRLPLPENYPGPESQPKLSGTASPAGRHGKPHQRSTYQLQQRSENFNTAIRRFEKHPFAGSFRL